VVAADFEVDELDELSLDELDELLDLSEDALDLSLDELSLLDFSDDFSDEPLLLLALELFDDSRLSVR
jgi:hypothetical protein